MTVADAYRLIGELARWIQSETAGQAQRLREAMARQRELERTLVRDAADCQRFIEDLKLLEAPLRLLEIAGAMAAEGPGETPEGREAA